MNQEEINLAVAKSTGESVKEIARRGFGLLIEYDEDELQPPQTIDWDSQVAARFMFP